MKITIDEIVVISSEYDSQYQYRVLMIFKNAGEVDKVQELLGKMNVSDKASAEAKSSLTLRKVLEKRLALDLIKMTKAETSINPRAEIFHVNEYSGTKYSFNLINGKIPDKYKEHRIGSAAGGRDLTEFLSKTNIELGAH